MKKKKPITVLDAEQKKIGTTYSHRAQGLVMKGRARFIDENTIILDEGIPPCPPDINVNQEDIEMKELAIDTNEIVENGFGEIVETGKNVEAKEAVVEEAAEVSVGVTEAEIFEELKLIRDRLTDFRAHNYALTSIATAVCSICGSENNNDEDINECINIAADNISTAREDSINMLIDIYSAMLEKLRTNGYIIKDKSGSISEAQIFDELKKIRESLTDTNSLNYVFTTVDESVEAICGSSSENMHLTEAVRTAVNEIANVSRTREESVRKMMDIYSSMLK